ncbi:MAG: carboxypeptidase-like regulatory domain-containing protein, partial [Paludibacteraceae bacterium]|nr:carboxypeptidase-like regulatory domain-containing protein [Paludibacteraceae bacterium]
MKHIFATAIALFIFVITLPAATIKGKIIDTNNQPLDYVNVVLLHQSNDALAGGSITDAAGFFTVDNMMIGIYRLEVSFIGYKTYTKTVTVKSPTDKITVNTIKLEEDAQVLGEVEVVGQASQMRFDIDKKVFNVDQNIVAAGASATDVLENIPSVQVDNDGNVSLRNNSNVEIWINGKPSGLDSENRAQILEQMPAGSIESVEIITNPSAKYSPEGTAGIINLVMKKDRKSGYMGSVSTGLSYQLKGKVSGNASANFNYNSSKIDFYASLGFRQRRGVGTGYTDRYSFKPNTNKADTLLFMHQENNMFRDSWGLFGRTGLSWHINEKNTIGVSGMFNTQDNDNYS